LIELLVVIVLIAIMTAMIIPEMRGSYQDALLRSSSRKLVSVFDLAYSRAVSGRQIHRVRIDPASGKYVIERTVYDGENGGGLVPVRDVPGGEGEIDFRISILVSPSEESLDPAMEAEPEPEQKAGDEHGDSQRNSIAFYPDGTADAREILLQDRDGFQLALRINPITSRIRLIELNKERR